jgi:hypothetical protein
MSKDGRKNTHIDQQEVRVAPVHGCTKVDLRPKGTNTAHSVCGVSMNDVRCGLPKCDHIEEVIDEVELRLCVTLGTVHVTIKGRVRDIERCLPVIGELYIPRDIRKP